MPQRLEARQFSEDEVRTFIASLAGPRGKDGSPGRFSYLHQKIKERDQHFYNAEEADQKLPPPHDSASPYQTDILRRKWVEGKGRLVENPWRVRVVPPEDSPEQNRLANDFETVLQRGVELACDRLGVDIQDELADGQWLHCYGVLHWQKAMDVWPKFEAIEDEPADKALERNKHEKARAGFPFYFEVIRPDQFAFIEDRSVLNGMAYALVIRTVPLVEYNARLRETDRIVLSINADDSDILIFEERDAPSKDDPSHRTVTPGVTELEVAHFWTRKEFYELVRASGEKQSDWKLVKSFSHPYEMPPFAIAEADKVNHPDPFRAYLPASEGLYRIKPFYDHDVTLGRVIAEQIALPFYWIKLADGSFMTDAEGNRRVFSRNALAAEALPAGAELVKVDFEMNEAFISFLELTGQELQEASPDTGRVEVGASTQPWTIRLAQEQANTIVKRLKIAQAKCIRTCLRNLALVMSKPASEGGIGQPVYVYAKTRAGKVDKTTAIGVDPEKIPTLEIEVDIDPFSSSQTVSNIEHMRSWLADPNVPFTKEDFLEQAFREEDPQKKIEAWEAERIFDERIKPGIVEQELARRFGDAFVVTPGLDIVGMGGDRVEPQQVLAQNGVRPVQASPGVPGAFQAESAPMNDMLSLQAPGTTELPGVPG